MDIKRFRQMGVYEKVSISQARDAGHSKEQEDAGAVHETGGARPHVSTAQRGANVGRAPGETGDKSDQECARPCASTAQSGANMGRACEKDGQEHVHGQRGGRGDPGGRRRQREGCE